MRLTKSKTKTKKKTKLPSEDSSDVDEIKDHIKEMNKEKDEDKRIEVDNEDENKYYIYFIDKWMYKSSIRYKQQKNIAKM